jgi:hypothetical protein
VTLPPAAYGVADDAETLRREAPALVDAMDAAAAAAVGEVWAGLVNFLALVPGLKWLHTTDAEGQYIAKRLLAIWPSLSALQKLDMVKYMLLLGAISTVYGPKLHARSNIPDSDSRPLGERQNHAGPAAGVGAQDADSGPTPPGMGRVPASVLTPYPERASA